ncbi:hypothetical protein FSS13T_01220 [Flavobacterium saliperosum S13]|nr:hypothetical protein FSS13T_01220 [Flavobacterium saliperosum S13]
MEVAYCFVEVFNKSSQQWELLFDERNLNYDFSIFISGYNEITKQQSYYYSYPELPEKTDVFFNSDIDSHALLHCFRKIENQSRAFNKKKGLPQNVSSDLQSKYNFLFNEIGICCEASCIILHELTHFDYDQLFNIYSLPKYRFKELKTFCYEDLKAGSEKFISYRDYLGKAYFEELEYLQSFEDSCSVRIIYFVEDRTELWESLEAVAPYFKGQINIVKRLYNISDKSYWDIESMNYNLLSYFIKKVSRNETENDRIEYLAAKARDLVLDNLKPLFTGTVADNSRNHLISRFEIAEKLFVLGCNKGKADISYFRNLWEMQYGWVYKSAKREMFLLRTIYERQVVALVDFVNGITENPDDDTLIDQLKKDLEN